METFARDAFAVSYPNDVKLRVNHNDRSSIPCSLAFCIARGGLDFVASVPDSPQARVLLARKDDIRGVSVECLHRETILDRAVSAIACSRQSRSRGCVARRCGDSSSRVDVNAASRWRRSESFAQKSNALSSRLLPSTASGHVQQRERLTEIEN